jgi:plastocyanin
LFLTHRDSVRTIEGVRGGLLIARVAFVGVLAVLVFASDGSGAAVRTVAITATGTSPSTVSISPSGEVLFVNRDSVAHTVVLRQNPHARWTCSLGPAGAPSGSDQCVYGAGFVSRHAYTVDGRFPGTVLVLGLARSVSLTARTHTVALGRRLTLHGKITFESWRTPGCTDAFPFSLAILTRHDRSQQFTRIAYFPVRPTRKNTPATNNPCTYVWKRSFRPGVATTYIAKVRGYARIWRLATSRPFTVQIRP